MKKIGTICMLLVLFTSVFSQGIVVLRYFINKAYIADKLCENKKRPMLHCDGKCVLAKKLQQQEKQEKNSGISFTEKFEVLSNGKVLEFHPEPSSTVLSTTWHTGFSNAPTDRSGSIFHPPNVA